ncbi:MAG TPA: AAA family ATPase [Bacillota bacterium]|nr:AAA family ATPase [Bacillota bacterium]
MHDDAFFDTLAAAYIRTMSHHKVSNPKVMIIFSGTPGSGKTTLARHLAADLQGQYIQNDAVRDIMRAMGVNPVGVPMVPITRRIVEHIMAHDANQLVVIDGSIDRTWQEFFDHASKLGALPVVVRLDVPLETLRARITNRDRHDQQRLLENLDNYQAQFENCKRHVPTDITLGESYNYGEVLASVRDKIKSSK